MYASIRAQPGIFSIGANNQLNKIKTVIKKYEINIACCCVSARVETNNPNPNNAIRYTAANR